MQSIKPVNPPPARFSRAKSAYGGFKKTLLVAAVLSAAAFSVSAYETGSLTLSNPEFPEDYISDLYWNLEDFRDFTDWVGETGVVGNNHQTLVVTDSAEGFAGVNTSTLTVEAYSLATLRNSNRLDISIADVTRGYETTWVNAPVRGDNKPTELSGTLDVGVFFNQGLRTDISAFAIGLSSSGSGLTLNGGTLNVSAVAEADMSAESQIKFASTLALPAEGTVLEREDYSLRYYLAPYARNYGFYYVSSIGMIGAPAADPVLVFNSGTLNVTGAIKIQDELTTLDPVIDAPLGRYESNGHYAEIKALGPTDPTTSEHFIASFQVVGMRGGFMSYENYDAQSASVISTPIQYPEPLIHTIHLVNTGMITAKASVEKSLTKNGEAAELQFTDDSSPVEVYGMFAEAHAPQIRVEVANYGFIKTSGGDRNHAVFARTSNNGQIDISAITVRAGEGGGYRSL